MSDGDTATYAYVCASCLGTVIGWDYVPSVVLASAARVIWVHLDPPAPSAAHAISAVIGRGYSRPGNTWDGHDDRD